MKPIRIVIADDHQLFIEGLEKLLESRTNFTVVGQAATDEALLAGIGRWNPDVVLLDLHLPEHGGIQAIRGIKLLLPRCIVIILTMDPNEEMATEAVRTGANGYLLKEITLADLSTFIQRAMAGDVVFSPSIAPGALRRLVQMTREPAGITQAGGLSSREQQILELIARGLSNREIAGRLSLSENTIRHHTTSIYRKLGVTRRSQAVRHVLAEKAD